MEENGGAIVLYIVSSDFISLVLSSVLQLHSTLRTHNYFPVSTHIKLYLKFLFDREVYEVAQFDEPINA